MVLGDFDRDEGDEHNEVRREWEELQEGEVQENIPDEAARAEFSEEEEEGWEESEEFVGDDPPDDPEELPPVFAQEKPLRPQWRGHSAVELPRRPMGWNGKPKQRGLVKPDEVRQAFSPHERLLILDLAAEWSGRRGLRASGGNLEAHPLPHRRQRVCRRCPKTSIPSTRMLSSHSQ